MCRTGSASTNGLTQHVSCEQDALEKLERLDEDAGELARPSDFLS